MRKSWMGRTSVRLAAVGGLAVAVAAGVAVAQTAGGVDGRGRPRSVVPGVAGSVANAKEALLTAATRAQDRPFTPPRPDQWIYTETRYQDPGKPEYGKVQTPKSPLKTRIEKNWVRADGKVVWFYDKGRLISSPTGGGMPPTDYPTLAALPRDPRALLNWIDVRSTGLERTQERRYAIEFAILGSMLNDNGVIPPATEAAIYRALAIIPGVTLTKDTYDVAGRPALAVTRVSDWVSEQLLLDKVTFAYRGERDMAVQDHSQTDPTQRYTGKSGAKVVVPGGTWAVKKGTIQVLVDRVAAGIVDKPGQLPNS